LVTHSTVKPLVDTLVTEKPEVKVIEIGTVFIILVYCIGVTYDISNKHRLGYSEVELVQKMIDGVNTLWAEDKELAAKHGL